MKWNKSDGQGEQGVAFTRYLVAKMGHIFRGQEANDRGIDAHVELVQQDSRQATGEIVGLQVKGGPSFFEETTKTGVIYRGSLDHLDYWFNHCLPVFLVLVETEKQKAYWQELTDRTVERLPKGWKVEVPFTNDIEINFVSAARGSVGLEPSSTRYTRLKLDDTSNGMTKRYAAQVLVCHPITRLRLEAVVRQATAEIRKETYHRTTRLTERFQDCEAQVVSLYLAADLNDEANSNWLCRTMWVNTKLVGDGRPSSIGGVDLGDGLEVIWNSEYGDTSRFLRTLEINKQTFLAEVQQMLVAIERIVAQTFGKEDKCIVDETTARQNINEVQKLYLQSSDIGIAPYECRDVAGRFEDVMALVDNAFIHIKTAHLCGGSDGATKFLLEITLRDYRKNLERLHYEIEKVT